MRLEDYIKKSQLIKGEIRLIDFDGQELTTSTSNSKISIDFKLLFKSCSPL